MLKAVFFDLDGTLLPNDQDEFINTYSSLLTKYVLTHGEGYDKDSFLKTLFGGTMLMYKNDGSKSNEEVFWDNFAKNYGVEKLKDRKLFDRFYETDYYNIKSVMGYNEESPKIIKFCKENGLIIVLSTNPFFPAIATYVRMEFTGLHKEDFTFITTMENFSYCKPNPKFFLALMEKFNLKPDEVIVFGNNEKEDADCANKAGIKSYLIDSINYMKNGEQEKYNVIKITDVIEVIKSHI
jgi:FMN phosphatase YigB (HAD superfamily)